LNLSALAQATRTWVSGVGDDANPCSRTAPGKTFPGAFSKTAVGGEIDVLDPGGFGGVTITKSITIDGGGNLGGVLVSGTPGIVISAGTSDVVTLRNLNINGVGTGTSGVIINSCGVVRIENCQIFEFVANGINFAPSTPNAMLIVLNSHIYTCAGDGIFVTPGGIGANVVIENSRIEQCALGLHADTNSTTTVRNSLLSLNKGLGFDIAGGAVVSIDNTQVTLNGFGISSAGAATLSGVTVTGNLGYGLTNFSGGTITTFHNNRIFGNNPDGTPTGSLPLK